MNNKINKYKILKKYCKSELKKPDFIIYFTAKLIYTTATV